MKVYLIHDGQRRACTLPYAESDHVVADGACPHCKSLEKLPFKIAGSNQRPSEDDRAWEADAVALCCGRGVGILRVETNTLFGVREDRAVLAGRCRVY